MDNLKDPSHCSDVIMGAVTSQITSLTIVYSTVYSDADQTKHQSSASPAFVRGIHRGPVNSPHKWPVTRKMFSFDDVIMIWVKTLHWWHNHNKTKHNKTASILSRHSVSVRSRLISYYCLSSAWVRFTRLDPSHKSSSRLFYAMILSSYYKIQHMIGVVWQLPEGRRDCPSVTPRWGLRVARWGPYAS